MERVPFFSWPVEWRDGAVHQRSLHQLRRLRAGVPEPGDLAGAVDLPDRSAQVHRVRRALRPAAVHRGVSRRMHPRRSGASGVARRAARQIPVAHRQGARMTFSFRVACASALLVSCAAAGADTPAPRDRHDALAQQLVPAPAEKPGKAAIASAHHLATAAGHEVLAMGGNAFDAAVAVGAALAVVEPSSSGMGGGAFFLIHRASDGHQAMVDAREMAPAAIDAKMYLDAKGELDRDKSVNGALAAGIPGEPAAFAYVAQKYGKLPLSKSLAPAIRLAKEGFPFGPRLKALIGG